jgi:hypothetical protein
MRDYMKITINDLRSVLFHVNNQEMSIAELRKKLFDLDNIDNDIIEDDMDFDKIFRDRDI